MYGSAWDEIGQAAKKRNFIFDEKFERGAVSLEPLALVKLFKDLQMPPGQHSRPSYSVRRP